MDSMKIAMILQNMVKDFGKLSAEMEALVKSEEIPQSERDYQIAKEKACAKLRADGKAIGEIDMKLKGLCSDELFRRDCALYKYNGLRCRIDILGKQMNAYQSINKHYAEV